MENKIKRLSFLSTDLRSSIWSVDKTKQCNFLTAQIDPDFLDKIDSPTPTKSDNVKEIRVRRTTKNRHSRRKQPNVKEDVFPKNHVSKKFKNLRRSRAYKTSLKK